MMCQCRSINCNKCTFSGGGVNNGEAIYVWEQGTYGKSMYLMFNVAVNLPKK